MIAMEKQGREIVNRGIGLAGSGEHTAARHFIHANIESINPGLHLDACLSAVEGGGC
jgi:hypothetical protein